LNETRKKSLELLTNKNTSVIEKVTQLDNVMPFMHKNDPFAHGFNDAQKDEFLRKLPQDQIKLLHLKLFYGFSKDEAVKYTKIPSGTIKTRLRKALIDVSKILDLQ
jgi:DNA-directed RNA polymerase specialized sigma24 family protein